VESELLAEIEYRAKSAEGKLRHPFKASARMICELCVFRSVRMPNDDSPCTNGELYCGPVGTASSRSGSGSAPSRLVVVFS
jgi:hypothetical protein